MCSFSNVFEHWRFSRLYMKISGKLFFQSLALVTVVDFWKFQLDSIIPTMRTKWLNLFHWVSLGRSRRVNKRLKLKFRHLTSQSWHTILSPLTPHCQFTSLVKCCLTRVLIRPSCCFNRFNFSLRFYMKQMNSHLAINTTRNIPTPSS